MAGCVVGCGGGASVPRCEMGVEHTLAQAAGMSFDELAIATLAERSYAFWSDNSGLYGRALKHDGKSAGEAVRVGERCAGGVAVASSGAQILLSCVRPFSGEAPALSVVAASAADVVAAADPDDDADDLDEPEAPQLPRGEVVLLWLDSALTVTRTQVLGEAGRLSFGVDVVVVGDGVAGEPAGEPAGEVAVVWHDGSVESSRVWLWRAGVAERLMLSSPASVPASPSITAVGKQVQVAWAEANHDPRNPEQRLVLSRGAGVPLVMTTVKYADPTPRLRALPAAHGEALGKAGGLYLAFRDRREPGRKAGLYLSRVSEHGKLVGELARLSRADGKAGPAIVGCFGGVLAAAPRTFGGGKFIGVNWADSALKRTSLERQYYQDARQFAVAAATCLADHALLLIGEQGTPERPAAHLRTVEFRCR